LIDRRGFLQTSAAAVAAGLLSPRSQAQGPAGQQPASEGAQAPLASGRKLKVDAYSRHLQWLRSADEVADAAIEMAFTGVDVTVRPFPGHVDPAKVATDLPPFVNTLRKHGLEVSMITCPITDADSPNAEQILQTASSLGIHHYWWGTFRYEQGKPVMQQLDALKPRVEKLAKLNEKYKMKALYHTYSMPGTVGCNVWDFLTVLRNFDPAYVAFHWDVGHTSLTGGNGTWAESLRASGPYIGGLSVKEYTYELALETPGGGPFTGTPEQLSIRGFGGGGAAGGAAQARPAGGANGAGGPRGGNGAAGLPPSAAAEQAAPERGLGQAAPAAVAPGVARNPNQPDQPPLAGRGAQPGAPRQQAAAGPGPRGAGGRPGAANGRGGGGQPLPWRARAVPLGEGINNLPLLATVLKEIGFEGPVEIQSEYPNGGAENAQDKITLPRAMVLGAMKRDLLTLKAGFAASGLL
jgi:sugar phosphate isomerase/epimerase